MRTFCNEHPYDRVVRVFIGTFLLVLGYFWLGGMAETVVLVVGTVVLMTGFTGFCALYTILGINTCREEKHISYKVWSVLGLLLVLLIAGGSYASILFSTKFFLEDYNRMNNFYKQTLFNTGQDNRALSQENYAALVSEYAVFQATYATYRPYVLRGDAGFTSDTARVAAIIAGLKNTIATGDLHEAHLTLETIRPIFQDILKRNGFSMLAVALVDFHDAMEAVIAAADARDASGVLTAYTLADEKLRAVEDVASDEEISRIRANLDATRILAEERNLDALPGKAAELKSSFVKVYLQRG